MLTLQMPPPIDHLCKYLFANTQFGPFAALKVTKAAFIVNRSLIIIHMLIFFNVSSLFVQYAISVLIVDKSPRLTINISSVWKDCWLNSWLF